MKRVKKRNERMLKAQLVPRIKSLKQGTRAVNVALEHEQLLHELQVHQVELETQNRELRESQLLLEGSRDRYADLYDFAPVGYVTLDDKGIIREINLTAAAMLGIERTRLVGLPFYLHLAMEDRARFREHLKALSDVRMTSELNLIRKGADLLPVVMQSVLHYDERKKGFTCRTILTDITERKQAEREAQRSAELNHGILSSLNAHIAVLDKAGTIIAVNEAWNRFARENSDTALARTGVGMNYLEVCLRGKGVQKSDAQKALKGIQSVLDGTLPGFGMDYPCDSPHAKRWFQMTVTPLSAGGRGAVVSHQDISQRRFNEAALSEKEARLRAVLDTAVDAIITIDERGVIESFNLAAEKLFGYPADEVVGMNISMLMPSPHREQHDRYLANYRATGERKIIGIGREVSGKRKDGSNFPLELSVSEVQLADRRIFTGIVRDITQRKRAESELREQTQRYQSLVEASPDAIFVLKKGRIEFVNPEGLRLFGVNSAADVLGKSPFDFFRRDRREVIEQRIDQLSMADGASPLVDEELVRPDGSTRWVTVSAGMFEDDRGMAVQFILRDVTDRRRLETELLEVTDNEQRRIGHDLHDGLGQQLTAMEMKCFNLMEDLKADDLGPIKKSLRKQAAQINQALRQCITATRSIARGLAPVALKHEGLTGALEKLASITSVPGKIKCRFICRAPVVIDNFQTVKHLYRIAQEAVNNALKHARMRHIDITLTLEHGTLRLQITDDGRGLPKRGDKRAGMGLEVMRHRAHVIGASLGIESMPGKGVSVTCTLPLKPSRNP